MRKFYPYTGNGIPKKNWTDIEFAGVYYMLDQYVRYNLDDEERAHFYFQLDLDTKSEFDTLICKEQRSIDGITTIERFIITEEDKIVAICSPHNGHRTFYSLEYDLV